jgi:hypothetical protein
MPISPGSKWGEEIVPPTAIRSFGSDRELGTALRDNSLNSQPQGALHLVSDDFRSLLGLKELTKRTTAIKIRIDALAISYTDKHGGTHQDVCIGSLHIGRPLRGTLNIVTNTGWWRGHDIAPRAHPNDGKLDIVEVARTMTARQRITAWRRSLVGTHLPHPNIAYSQSDFYSWSGKLSNLTVDGEKLGKVSHVQCRVQSDCTEIMV